MAPPQSEIICKYIINWSIAHVPDGQKLKNLKTVRISGHMKLQNVDIVRLSVYWYTVFGEKNKYWHYINEKLNTHFYQQFS